MRLASPWLTLGAESFGGLAEFREFRKRHAATLSARAERDHSHAAAERSVRLAGTCGLCLQPAVFTASTARGQNVATGRVPFWRDQLGCDCEAALLAHERAMLQFLLAAADVQPWQCGLVLGEAPRLAAALACFVGRVQTGAVPLLGGPGRLDFPHSQHWLLAPEVLNRAASPERLLTAAAAALVPGGQALFSCRFEPNLAHGSFVSDNADATLRHRIGWDVLSRLREAGFRTATAHLYWSEEFGYLGSANFILAASR